MPSIVKRVQIEPLPLELQLSIFNKIRICLLREAHIDRNTFLCRRLRTHLKGAICFDNVELIEYPKDVMIKILTDSWNIDTDSINLQISIINSLPNKLTLVKLLELAGYRGYMPSGLQEVILGLLFPLFHRTNIQEHSDKEFITSGSAWFSNVTPVYIPREFGDKKLFNKFTKKSNYHRYIFICKIIEQLELMIKVKQ